MHSKWTLHRENKKDKRIIGLLKSIDYHEPIKIKQLLKNGYDINESPIKNSPFQPCGPQAKKMKKREINMEVLNTLLINGGADYTIRTGLVIFFQTTY